MRSAKRTGLKLDLGEWGYGDLFYSYRRYFVVDNQTGALRAGIDLWRVVNLDAGAAVVHSQPLDEVRGELLYDLDAAAWIDLGQLVSPLAGLRVTLLYQVFVEPELVQQVGMLRLSYRYRNE